MNVSQAPVFAIGPEDHALTLLERLRTGVLKHPRAAVAIFDALVVEGRRYAKSAEGAELKEHLESSVLLTQLEQVFDYATLGVLDARENEALDLTALADAIFELALRDDAWQLNTAMSARDE